MKYTKLHSFLAISALAISFVAPTMTKSQTNEKFTPDQKLRYAEYIIENFYVDTVAADSLVNEAIVAMLKTLDPHSSYTSPEETRELNQPLEGKFSGIGIQFSIVRDTVCVVQTTQGGPSQRAGLIPGDRIIYVNDTLFTHPKMVNTQVTKSLRGPKGTTVNLKVKRGTDPELINFRLVRDDIPIYSVDNIYMATPEVGYLHISRFAEDTPNELDRAIATLKGQGMKHLVIDLEDNGGGFLGAAYELAARFLDPGDLVVYTGGRSVNPSYLHVEKGMNKADVDRVVVMVNQYSASASEIASGALQDHDRGVIVGRRTYGKGLVQRPFPFPDGSMIRLTTSHYYTPSGRSIQKHYEKGRSEEYQLDLYNRLAHGELWSADSIKVDQSQKFRTLNSGRLVYGGGGIIPDVFVPVDTSNYSTYYRDIVAKGIMNRFVTDYLDANRKDLLAKYPDADSFSVGFDAAPVMEKMVVVAADTDSLVAKPEQLERSGALLTAMLKGLLERDLYDNGSYLRSVNMFNPVYREAISTITDEKKYKRLLENHDEQ